MHDLHEKVKSLKNQFIQSIEASPDLASVETVRIDFLGRNGRLAAIMKQLKTLPLDIKRTLGPVINELKLFMRSNLAKKIQDLEAVPQQDQDLFDVTAYRPKILYGSLHVYTQLIEQLEDIFISMGFSIEDGPEVETDYHNFESLNIPKDHPARDSHDTFWLDSPGMLLRTHTSTVETRAMERKRPPIAIFAPGRCYRNEATDATHDFMFTQAEGLFVDKNVSIANLLATAKQFFEAFFEKKEVQLRVRPGYFPFVEPGLEIDISCPFCKNGCSICKKTGWIEMLGAGLTHPKVLQQWGIDPTIYSGFAFGCGLGRLAMIRYTINDIRLLHSNKINFLEQF